MAQFQGDFLEVIQIDLHYNLEVTVVQQGHFDIKINCSAETVRDAAKFTIEH